MNGSEKITRNTKRLSRGKKIKGREPAAMFIQFFILLAVICDCITRSKLISITLALQNEKHEPTLFQRHTLSSTSFPSAHNTHFCPFPVIICAISFPFLLPLRFFHTCHFRLAAPQSRTKGNLRPVFSLLAWKRASAPLSPNNPLWLRSGGAFQPRARETKHRLTWKRSDFDKGAARGLIKAASARVAN